MRKLWMLNMGECFMWNGEQYTVLEKDREMIELVDSSGKLWAWPSNAVVK